MIEALISQRHLVFACGDFQPIAKGEAYPGVDDEATRINEDTPYLVKARHRAPGGQKYGVIRAFSSVDECERAVASLQGLHFITEYMVIDERDHQKRFKEEPEFGLVADDADQPPPPVGPFPQGVWIKVVPGVVQASAT